MSVAQSQALPLRLRFDDGSTVEVPRRGVIGRSPDTAGEFADAMSLRLHDDERRISKTHLEIGLDERGCWVRDLGSANGTEVIVAGAGSLLLEAGQQRYLRPGAVVRLGGREFALLAGGAEGAHA